MKEGQLLTQQRTYPNTIILPKGQAKEAREQGRGDVRGREELLIGRELLWVKQHVRKLQVCLREIN